MIDRIVNFLYMQEWDVITSRSEFLKSEFLGLRYSLVSRFRIISSYSCAILGLPDVGDQYHSGNGFSIFRRAEEFLHTLNPGPDIIRTVFFLSLVGPQLFLSRLVKEGDIHHPSRHELIFLHLMVVSNSHLSSISVLRTLSTQEIRSIRLIHISKTSKRFIVYPILKVYASKRTEQI